MFELIPLVIIKTMSGLYAKNKEKCFHFSYFHYPGATVNDPKIINLIVSCLVGPNIPEKSYTLAQTEWSDGTRSDVLYSSDTGGPPIIIESQYCVDQEFMLRLISYASHAYKRYKVLPVVLVIVTKSFSNAEFKDQFITSSQGFLLEATCNFWAERCFLLPASSVSNFPFNEKKIELDPMIGLGFFTTHHTLKKIHNAFLDDPILSLLSCTANKILSQESDSNKSSTSHLLQKIKANLENILKDSGNSDAKEGLSAIEKLENELGTNEQQPEVITTYTEEDYNFIESSTKPNQNKNWKKTFDQGKKRRPFQILQIVRQS